MLKVQVEFMLKVYVYSLLIICMFKFKHAQAAKPTGDDSHRHRAADDEDFTC